jgi:hypothetical protein
MNLQPIANKKQKVSVSEDLFQSFMEHSPASSTPSDLRTSGEGIPFRKCTKVELRTGSKSITRKNRTEEQEAKRAKRQV